MRPIGIFDSGVGGLGIFRLAVQQLPHHDFVYIADNANLPFGNKSVEELHHITEKIVRFLIEQHDVQAVVIACNTATVACIDYLRTRFSMPIVGAVPVVKPACQLSKNKRVAILATPTTAKSAYLKNLIERYANGVGVLVIPCPGLAEMVESGDLESPHILEALKLFLSPARAHDIDVIGLGCTQYPFLRQQIAKLIPPHIVILDSNEAVAQQLKRVIGTQAQDSFGQGAPTYTFYTTKDATVFFNVAQKLIGSMVKNCLYVKM